MLPIKAALADRKIVVKTGSIFMGRGRVMGRGSAESRLRGMGRVSVGAWLRGMGRGRAGKEFRGMGSRHQLLPHMPCWKSGTGLDC